MQAEGAADRAAAPQHLSETGATASPETVFAPRAYQRDALADRARFQAWMWSRQTGKGFTVALKINSDILDAYQQGRAKDWLLLSRSLSASRQLGRKVRAIGKAMCAAMQLVEPSIEQLDDKQFELVYPGGSRVLVLSSNPDAAVGFTGDVVIDEIDTHKQAHELLGNTLPVVSTGQHGLIVTSTPRGRRVMHAIHTDAHKPGTVWSFRKLNIFEAVAQGCDQDPAVLRRGILDDLKWRQEYLCEFVDDEICWIPWELITGCTSDQAYTDYQPQPGEEFQVYAGWDVARWNHLSVLWVLRRAGNALYTVGVHVMHRMPFDEQINFVRTKLAPFGAVRRLTIDAGGMGEMVVEQATKRLSCPVEGVKFTLAIKEKIAGDVRRLMEERNLLIPDNEQVQNEFHSLRRTVTAAGNARFEGEVDGSHADRFWACGLGVHAAVQPAGVIDREQLQTLTHVGDHLGRKLKAARGSWP